MLTQVLVKAVGSPDQTPLVLPVGGPSKYPISFIDGLSPADAQISTSKYAIVCGEHFEGSRVNMRNIVITLELEPDYAQGETAEDLRAELYSYFPIRREVSLEFRSTGYDPRTITGYVESFEAPLFAQDPAVQVSVLCPNPYFENALSENTEMTVPSGVPISVFNEGDTSVGAEFQVTIGGASDTFTLSRTDAQGSPSVSMTFNRHFPKDSSVLINTATGSKTATLVGFDGGNLIPHMALDSEWIRLEPGENLISYQIEGSPPAQTLSVSFRERFVGL